MANLTKNQNQPAGLDGLTKSDGTVVVATPLDSGSIVTDPNFGAVVSHIGPPGTSPAQMQKQKLVDGTQQSATSLLSDRTSDTPNFLNPSQNVTYVGNAAGFSLKGPNSTPVPAPSFSLPAGVYTSTQSVTITTSGSVDSIHYTVDGSNPTTGSPLYTAPVSITASVILRAVAVKSGYLSSTTSATYVLQQTAPSISPDGETFVDSTSATITASGADAIYFTTDNSTPTTSSTLYTGPVTINVSLPLKAIATKAGWAVSDVTTAVFTGTQTTPTFSPVAGTYTSNQSVTITSAGADAIYFTTDGSTPTTSSTLYTTPVTISVSGTLKAIAVRAQYSNSAVGSAAYVLQQATPTFSPVAGGFTSVQNVTISSSGADAIYYTTDGSTPTRSSSLYTGAVSVNVSLTLKALAIRAGYNDSAVGSAAYVLTQATPTFSPVGGSYSGTQSVTITSAGADNIYYTTDGSTPTTGSTPYSGAITVTSTETVKALAVKSGWTNSAVGSATYTLSTLIASAFGNHFGPTSPVDTTGASLLVIAAWYDPPIGGPAATISDTYSNTWTPITQGVSGTVQFFYAWNPTVGANHQVNFGVGVGSYVYLFAAFSDVQTISDPFETSSDSTHSGTTIQPGSVTPSATGDLLISSVGSQFGAGFTASIDSGFSLVPSSQTELKLAYLNALSTSPTDPTWTLNTSQSYGANIAVFAHA